VYNEKAMVVLQGELKYTRTKYSKCCEKTKYGNCCDDQSWFNIWVSFKQEIID